ncbi:hypothetical protein LTR37_006948 [Vermiconidia calcicola]|uniref:Uncharacterized protein n=1 Tax=Vermiconidia calcicola TaxID=1690605 RepID=A0ACC3NG37_9PEZI|nr:hypothetical protein LTR37_006948 [Vermiconidia calcicola]
MSPTTIPRPRKRARFRAARAFYITLLIGACFASYAILTHSRGNAHTYHSPPPLQKRNNDIRATLTEDEQCRLVHHSPSHAQCAFIKRECPNEESGFAAYLDLYYCRLPHAKPVAFTILISWLGLLFSTIGIAASDFFCINLSTIATILGMSESMAGVTFLAFGNGSPDVFSTFAAMSTNSGSLAVGELFGAAGFITAVVSGSMALIRPFHVARKSFVRDVGFFVVAAAFSMVFLWDGKLRFWECVTMVLFYIFYVGFVVAWHWWLGRRRRRREKEAVARGHFIAPGDELEIEEEEYQDDPDESGGARPPLSRGVSREDWSALERGGGGASDPSDRKPDEDEEEEARDRWMADLNSNMRLTRPTAGRGRSHTNTLTPVRPSLVGALEFQAVLKSLQKSRNIQTYPMNTRRYSDDPTYTTAQQQDQMSSISDPASRPPYKVAVHADGTTPTLERQGSGNLEVPYSAPPATVPPAAGRLRAVSANDARGLRIDPDLRSRGSRTSFDRQSEENLIDLTERDAQAQSQSQSPHHDTLEVPQARGSDIRPSSPEIEVTSPDEPGARRYASIDGQRTTSHAPHPSMDERHFSQSEVTDDNTNAPREVPTANKLPKIMVPKRNRSATSTAPTTPGSPFPRYQDSPFPAFRSGTPSPSASRPASIYLPAPASPESLPVHQANVDDSSTRPSLLSRWWPHSILPPPGIMISTLFPTIYHWQEKNHWEKALGVVAAPSVFLLTVTLPVVESSGEMEGEEGGSGGGPGGRKDDSFGSAKSKGSAAGHDGLAGIGDTASAAVAQQQNYVVSGSGNSQETAGVENNNSKPTTNISSTATLTAEPESTQPELWNRWLLILQLFLAPLFILFSIYSQSPTDITPHWLLRPTLICLLISLILLIPLLLTSTPTHKPQPYRYILSLAGFVVSISWISTIAAQVVGALKALAVILNMSHAIMGLTIFAVGNSLGDLVADVTVARLGYPVMALSACFGGPMLNILLGIGLSGSWILFKGANKRIHRHPDKDFKFHSYHIEVENTLIVSGATLLVTLVGLLVAVPMNNTVGNVVLEVTGLVGKGGSSEDLLS